MQDVNHMRRSSDRTGDPWHDFDLAAFGLIYGTITSLSVLMAMSAHPEAPFRMAAALFGSVLAVTLAKAFAEVIAAELERCADAQKKAFTDAWRHSRPTLVAANVPTGLILASGTGLLPTPAAIGLAQGFGILLLLVLGGRVGWIARRKFRSVLLGALFTGGIGLALSAMKYLMH
ncbi:hypothetical protein [Rhodosalinus sp. K401]|uniref:hypothetical protein n=1 Tax=Rhodosalinus sp. K401 TaxID=3239195 RepID=UPI003524FE02